MPTIHVRLGSADRLQDIADSLWKAKKIVVVTGAGISTNSGIPDFRSENGLYSIIQGQFDAAAKSNRSKTPFGGGASDDSSDERPRKRRNLSLGADSIKLSTSFHGMDALKEATSIEVMVPDLSESSLTSDDAIRAASQEDDESPRLEASRGQNWEAPAEGKVASLSENSVLVDNCYFQPSDGNEEAQAQLAPHCFSLGAGQRLDGARRSARPPGSSNAALPSERPSSLGSATCRFEAQSSRQHDTTSLVFRTPKSSRRLKDPIIVPSIVPSSDTSTLKQACSDFGSNSSCSPASSPPLVLSDPYEDPSTDSPSSSSSYTSQESGPDTEPTPLLQSPKRLSLPTMKGRDLFDASIWADPVKTSVFYTFATNLRRKSRDASPSGSHHFISQLRNSGRMVRCYTQNIDLLEDKVGLSTRLLLGPGSRSRFNTRALRAATTLASRPSLGDDDHRSASLVEAQSPITVRGHTQAQARVAPRAAPPPLIDGNHRKGAQPSTMDEVEPLARPPGGDEQRLNRGSGQQGENGGARPEADGAEPSGHPPKDVDSSNPEQTRKEPERPDALNLEPDRGVECVCLHGSLRFLRCFQCRGVVDWDEGIREMQTMSGQQPSCPRCANAAAARQERGKRALGIGKLRPDIVLYGEEHPESQRISDIIQHDISLAPDLLIIMGTSLKVHGLKTVVKEFAKAVHNKREGKVVFINYTKPADSVWADTIDFWVEMDCDAWVHDLKERKPIIWSPPGTVDEEIRSTKRRRRTNEAEAAANKKADKTEKDVEFTPASKNTENTVVQNQGDSSRDVTPPAHPRPRPQRPAAFRDHRANGAYLTTKIMADLAFLSGREVVTYSKLPAVVRGAQRKARTIPRHGPELQSTFDLSPQCYGKGRGPRLKKARKRKPLRHVSATCSSARSDDTVKSPARSGLDQHDGIQSKNLGRHADHAGHAEYCTSSVHKSPVALVQGMNSFSDVKGLEDLSTSRGTTIPAAKRDTVTDQAPLDDHASGPTVEDNSIITAVKSNHRIRKPKAVFDPEPEPMRNSRPGRGTPIPANANTKSKVRVVPQANRPKASGQGIKIEQAPDPEVEQAVLVGLAYPPPRSSSLPGMSNGSRCGTAVVDACALAPLRVENLAASTPCNELNMPRVQPPAYLEPTVVVAGPPLEMSPTVSGQHWKNCASLSGEPQSRRLEGLCRGLDSTPPMARLRSGSGKSAPSPPRQAPRPQLAAQLAIINVESLLSHQSVSMMNEASRHTKSDSPSRQLQREHEAAAALSQLRRPSMFNETRFARI